jgi:hypothetical protein
MHQQSDYQLLKNNSGSKNTDGKYVRSNLEYSAFVCFLNGKVQKDITCSSFHCLSLQYTHYNILESNPT